MQSALQLSTASLGLPHICPWGVSDPELEQAMDQRSLGSKGAQKDWYSSIRLSSPLRNSHYLFTKSPQCLELGRNRALCPQPWLRSA